MSEKPQYILLVIILVVAGFLRLWQLGYSPENLAQSPPTPASIPPGLFSDEAMNGNNASEALDTGNYKVFYRENNGREGLYINLQALSLRFFGHTAFALRLVSALFGILSIWALWWFAREYTKNEWIALASSFFMATSFWHILFSRVGFRAIMAPFFLSAGLAALYYGWNRASDETKHSKIIIISALGGVLFGLGFHSYIAYRIAPLLLIPIIWSFIKLAKKSKHCVLCIPAIFLLFTFIAGLPLAYYFLQNPGDFLGRTSQISIMNSDNPIGAFLINSGKTIQSLYFVGDFNWRHNYAGFPALWWPVAVFFTIGVIEAVRRKYWMLFIWFFVMLLPVAFSSEGVPHSLRAIIMLPPIMIIAGVGLQHAWKLFADWLKRMKTAHTEASSIILRIQKALPILGLAILFAIFLWNFDLYFQRWSIRPEVKLAFNREEHRIALFLNELPEELPKYVLLDLDDTVDRTGRPMSIQPILFVTDTYLPHAEGHKNIHYITPLDVPNIDCQEDCIVIPPKNTIQSMNHLKEFFPSMNLQKTEGILVARPR
ncbi:MAG: glycosyltransferase family 39 protein [bacterium]|nr:glycosyltransferase family 39 protein [bacterium]